MNYTDDQLRLALAKMLPEKIIIEQQLFGYNFWWNNELVGIDDMEDVKDTEWLHVCWLVEQTLNQQEAENYEDEIEILVGLDTLKAGFDFAFIHTSWQQRAIALCKVKGVEVV